MQPGTMLAHFSVQDQIGAGGMGAVYRATDTQLGRDVALKILPPAFAEDAERLARFQREAQALAALQHPNIASIYGIERAEGQTCLVMELCEGEDLSAIIERGALPVEDARDIAGQIARGLEEAHEKGIIHRDLKPANVKVSAEGKVKILDFGLARTFSEEADATESTGLTMTAAASMTRPGVVLGTAAYMSPEQARGKGIDKRTDIWAFGVILYEMLTGRRLFTGETATDILASVLRTEPDFDALPQDLPLALTYVLRRCLDRNKDSRLRDIGEARCLVSDDTSASSLSLLAMPALDAEVKTRRRNGWLWPAVAGLALIALAGTLVKGRSSAPAAVQFTPRAFTQLTAQGKMEAHGVMGPDGNYFVYQARDGDDFDIFLQRAGGLNPINLTEDSSAHDGQPTVSPDGQSIAFTSYRDGEGIYLMGATGESARLLTRGGSYPAWSPDGTRVVYSTENFQNASAREETSELWTVDTDGKDAGRIPVDIDAIQPNWSPTGHRIAFWSVLNESGQRDIWTVRPDGTGLAQVTDDLPVDFCPVWSRDGRWLFFISNRGGPNNVWRVRVDEETGKALHEPRMFTLPSPDVRHVSLSPDGSRMVFTAFRSQKHLYRVEYDSSSRTVTGRPEPLLTGSMNIGWPRISADGEWIVFRRRSSQEDLYLIRSDGTGLRQLTDDAHRDRGAIWFDNDRHVMFYSDRGGKYDLWSIRPDGSDLSQLTDLTTSLWYPHAHPALDYATAINESGTTKLIWNEDRTRLDQAQPLADDPRPGSKFFGHYWSVDGRYLLGWSAAAINATEASITIFDATTGTYSHPVDGVTAWPMVHWGPNQESILFTKSDGIHVFDLNDGTDRVILTSEDLPAVGQFIVDPAGTALYPLTEQTGSDLWMAELDTAQPDG